MERLKTLPVRVGKTLIIGGDAPIVVQTMCNTKTTDIEGSVKQCLELSSAGAQMIRLTVPGKNDVKALAVIKDRLRSCGCGTALVADIHFSAETAIECAQIVEKVRINPGNFHPVHEIAREKFAELIEVCRNNGTAVRIGVNHGSLGKYITDKFGNSPTAMAQAAMEWLGMCIDASFFNVVVSLKSSNTAVMVEAYRKLVIMMKENGYVFPLHLGVTEAGGGESGRIKSCIGIGTLLQEGIGDTIRVSLTEPPVNEIPVAQYITEGKTCPEEKMLSAALEWGPQLLDRKIDAIPDDYWKTSGFSPEYAAHLDDEIMQAARRKFYKPEYIACPGCGRTMYNLQSTFEEVQKRTSHLKGMVIAVMGCIVNGPGEMADADWGYVGEGGGKVSIYKAGKPVLRHIPDNKAIDELLKLIEESTQHTGEVL